MKKSLMVLALMGGFTGSTSAQSSVTLFGVVDLNLRGVNNDSVKQYQMSQDGLQSSRLGVRGVEELGGGLRAGFWLEGALQPETGTPNGQTWQRRSTVSVSDFWGELRLGRDKTATYLSGELFDPFGDAGIGSAGNLVNSVLPIPSEGAGWNTVKRDSNMAAYFLPSGIGGGLYGQVQVAAGENQLGQKYFGARLGYAAGAFDVAFAYGKTQVTSIDDGSIWNLGGSWKLGFAKLMGYYARQSLADLKQDNWFIAAQAPIGVWLLKASYGEVSRSGQEPWANVEGQKAKQFAAGAVYDLSKRTALYGTWSGINNTDGAKFIVGNLVNVPGGGAIANGNSQGFEFGLRHSF